MDELEQFFIQSEEEPLADHDSLEIFGEDISAESRRGTILLLHGFDGGYPDPSPDPRTGIMPFFRKVRSHYQPEGFRVICPIYPTNISFRLAANQLHLALQSNGVSQDNLYIFGYSMGGLVARSLVADHGYSPKALITLCTPHHGTADWVTWFPYNDGAMSMWQTSRDLHDLNQNARDKKFRGKYRCIGLGYIEQGNGKQHRNDQLVEVTSQIMHNNSPRAGVAKWYNSKKQWTVQIGACHGAAQKIPDIDFAWREIQDAVRIY